MKLQFLSPSRYRPALASFAACFFLGAVFFFVFGGSGHSKSPQPIVFNHARHIEKELACTDCHVGAQTQEKATLPGIDVCITCHSTALTKSPEEEKIRTFAVAGQELTWSRVTSVPSHVYFSHRRHVQLGGLDCAECHGAMAKMTAPPTAPFKPILMDSCINCHQQKRARTDCNDCHR